MGLTKKYFWDLKIPSLWLINQTAKSRRLSSLFRRWYKRRPCPK